MAFTTGNDVNILQASDATTVTAREGDDRYIISGDLIADNQTISITDTLGANTIQLVGGLSIASSSVAADAAQLTLSNGAVITLLGASTFTYQIGGDSLTGTGGASQTYTEFVTTSLGLDSVPAAGEAPVDGTAVDVNEDGTTNGGSSSSYTLTAAADSVDEGSTATFNLTSVDVAEGTEVAYTISGVDAADVDGGSLTGTATIAADGTATISVALLADSATEGAETLTVTLDGTSVSDDITVNDTSTAGQTFTLTASADSVNEGSNVSVTITGSEGSAAGDEVAYTITGIDAADLVSGSLTGTATLLADLTATVTLELVADLTTEGEETLTFTLDDTDTSAAITVNDTSTTSTFELTEGNDLLSPTDENATATTTDAGDLISGVASALSAERTLDTSDVIDGGDGDDTLEVSMSSSFSGFASNAGISNVENINLTNTTTIGRTFDASGVEDVTKYTIDASNAGVSLSDLVESVAVHVSNQNDGNFTISYADIADTTSDVVGGTDDTMTISLTDNGVVEDTTTEATERQVVTATINHIEELTIDATGTNVIALGADVAKTITVTGTGSIEIDDVGTAVTSFDASAVEGSVTVDTTQASAGTLTSITTGAGDDKVTLNAGDILANASLAGGDGDDNLVYQDSGATVQATMSGFETFTLGTATGSGTVSFTNATDVTKIAVSDDYTGQDTSIVNMGSGDLSVEVTGSNAGTANNADDVITVDRAGAATVDLLATAAVLTAGTTNDAALDQGTDITLSKATSVTVNVGAYVDSDSDIIASAATDFTLNVASGKDDSSTPVELTEFSGQVTAAAATSVTIDSDGSFNGKIIAASAGSVVIEAAGELKSGAEIEAEKATSVEITSGSTNSEIKLDVAKAETIAYTAGADLTVSSDGDFAAVQELTINTDGAFSSGAENYAKLSSLGVEGANTKSAVTLGNLGSNNDYNLTVAATGMKAGFQVGTVDTGSNRDVSINVSDVTGAVTISHIGATVNDMDNVTVTAVDTGGAVSLGTVDASDKVTITNSSLGDFSVGTIGGNTATADVTIDLDETTGNITLSAISGDDVSIDASSAIGTLTSGSVITGTRSVTFSGTELNANTVQIDVDATNNDVTAAFTGGIAGDQLTFDVSNATNKLTSLSVDGGVGTDTLILENAATWSTTSATIDNIENITTDGTHDGADTITINGSAISGDTITLSGATANDDLVLSGTDNADTFDFSNVSAGGTAGDLVVLSSKGSDNITLSGADDIVKYSANTHYGDTITGFTSGTDKILFDTDALFEEGTESDTLETITSTGTVSANSIYIEISTATAAGGADTTSEVATFLAGLTTTVLAAGDIAMLAVNDGTDTYLYSYAEAATTGIQAGELTLVAQLAGVTNVADGDFVSGTA